MILNQRLMIRCTQDDLERWRAASDRAGLPLSVWIRHTLNEAPLPPPRRKRQIITRPAPQADPRLISQIARIGNNLNQIARWANTYKAGADSLRVLAALHEIREELREVANAHHLE